MNYFPKSTEQIKRVIKNERSKHLEEDTVDWFAREMKRVLAFKKNRKKGGWRNETFPYLLTRLRQESRELFLLYDSYKTDKRKRPTLIKETIDVANFAMMIADKARQRIP